MGATWIPIASLCLGLCIACGRAEEPPKVPERPPPTPEERARFDEANARCHADDDCLDLAQYFDGGTGTNVDFERARAAALKACLGGFSSACSKAVFMRDHVAAPGTHLMTDARCGGEKRDTFECWELESLREDEERASPEVKTACATLRTAGDAAAPSVIGPLVDRCPGLASPAQRERAKLFRSEDAIAKALHAAATASPRQVRRTYERLAPLGDPRAEEVRAIGVRRFATPPPAFETKHTNVLRIPDLRPQLDLCAIDGETAVLAPVENRASDVADILLRFVAPMLFPPAWPFLFPDAPKSREEQRDVDEAERRRAAEVERQLEEATGATTMMMIGTCDDVHWFAQGSTKAAK